MNPPILPWHKTAAAAIGRTYWNQAEDDDVPGDDEIMHIIARHDPAAAQHAETVRLLERALPLVADYGNGDPKLREEIRAHLATLRGEKGTK